MQRHHAGKLRQSCWRCQSLTSTLCPPRPSADLHQHHAMQALPLQRVGSLSWQLLLSSLMLSCCKLLPHSRVRPITFSLHMRTDMAVRVTSVVQHSCLALPHDDAMMWPPSGVLYSQLMAA